jgi:hypothetical protein
MQPSPPASQGGKTHPALTLAAIAVACAFVIIGGAVWISSSLGAVPGIWATIMYILFTVIATLIGILQFKSSPLTHPKASVNREAQGPQSPIVVRPSFIMPNLSWKAWIPIVLVCLVIVGSILWYAVYFTSLRGSFGPHFVDVFSDVLQPGFSINVNTSEQQHQWVTSESDALLLTYPDHQSWRWMAFVVGNSPTPYGHRPSRDVSLYRSLFADMRSTEVGQCVRIGIKDRTQPDDGREISVPECLTTQWLTYALPLNLFANVDLTHLSVMFEVVFQGSAGATVEVHNVRYSLNSVPTPVPPPLPRPFKVYTDWGATGNHYIPSG